MSARPLPRAARAAGVLLALGGPLVLGACDLILKAASPDRHLDDSIDCSSGACVCKAGLGDCDGDVDNGCETELGKSPNCGACGAVCNDGECLDGACACHAGFGDCDADADNGCEARFEDDPDNCGACNHRCGAGVCVSGVCQVTTVATVAGASSLEVTFGFVYVGSCNPAGPAIVSFETGSHASPESMPVVPGNGCVRALADGSSQLAWASDSAIFASGLLGGDAPTLLAGSASPTQLLAASSSSVYWWDQPADPTQHALRRVSTAMGSTPETLATGDITALTADFSNAYWSDAKGIHAVAHTGKAITDLSDLALASALATDFSTIYAADAAGVEAIPLAGGGPSNLLATAEHVVAIAADNVNVYWADQVEGTVSKVPAGGGTVTVLASGESFAPGVPIYTDSTSVYWLSGDAVRAVGK